MTVPAETVSDAGHPQPGAHRCRLVGTVFAGLDEAGVRWCLLRGGPDDPVRDDDVDLLVAAADLPRAVGVIEANGLIRLPAYGRGTHIFFLGLDRATGAWVEFDLVTEIAYGRKLEIRTVAAGECLARRERRHGAWRLAPEDEFWALLLHCLLDKRVFADHHMRRLNQLGDTASLDSPLVRAMPRNIVPSELLAYARAKDWSALAARRGAVLAAFRRAHPVAAARRWIGSAVLRLVERPLQAWSRRGVSVALLGPDGSGKSTLAEGIESAFYFPVRRVYMGLWAHDDRADGIAPQLRRILLRPFTIWRRYLASVRHRALGRLVIFDRYVYDALLPPRGPLVRLKRPYFYLLSRLCPAPDLVLLLDVPGPIMHARSGEYDPAHLEAERAQYQALQRRIPRLEHVDGHRAPEVVLADVLARIWQYHVERVGR
jgi:thymidylate kinase